MAKLWNWKYRNSIDSILFLTSQSLTKAESFPLKSDINNRSTDSAAIVKKMVAGDKALVSPRAEFHPKTREFQTSSSNSPPSCQIPHPAKGLERQIPYSPYTA